jgi:hypothetical protein
VETAALFFEAQFRLADRAGPMTGKREARGRDGMAGSTTSKDECTRFQGMRAAPGGRGLVSIASDRASSRARRGSARFGRI